MPPGEDAASRLPPAPARHSPVRGARADPTSAGTTVPHSGETCSSRWNRLVPGRPHLRLSCGAQLPHRPPRPRHRPAPSRTTSASRSSISDSVPRRGHYTNYYGINSRKTGGTFLTESQPDSRERDFCLLGDSDSELLSRRKIQLPPKRRLNQP